MHRPHHLPAAAAARLCSGAPRHPSTWAWTWGHCWWVASRGLLPSATACSAHQRAPCSIAGSYLRKSSKDKQQTHSSPCAVTQAALQACAWGPHSSRACVLHDGRHTVLQVFACRQSVVITVSFCSSNNTPATQYAVCSQQFACRGVPPRPRRRQTSALTAAPAAAPPPRPQQAQQRHLQQAWEGPPALPLPLPLQGVCQTLPLQLCWLQPRPSSLLPPTPTWRRGGGGRALAPITRGWW